MVVKTDYGQKSIYKMKTRKNWLLKILLIQSLLLCSLFASGANLKFVAVVYDMVTYAPVAGKQVIFQLDNISSSQIVYQQSFTTNANGEIVPPSVTVNISAMYSYSFSMTDCNNSSVVFSDTFMVSGNDTLFLFLGICHSVAPGNCVASFTSSADSLNAFNYSFTNTSTGNPAAFSWSFGDGTASSLENPVKSYNAPGAYLVCLTISDTSANCQSTKCDVINITQGVVLQAAFSHQPDSFSTTPRLMLFSDQTYSNINLNRFIWSFGDGNGALVANPVHQYQQSGQYQVCLISGYMGGLFDTVCQQITVPDYYNLWGQSFAGNSVMESGSIQLINPVHQQSGFSVIDEASIGNFGFYYFAQRINHEYLLRTFPDANDPNHADYLPTYSGNKLFWKDAERIILDTDVENYDVSLIKKTGIPHGIGSIAGSVQLVAGEYVKDAVVLLLDAADGKPVAFVVSDSSGNYFIGQLPAGTYRLLAEVPGLVSSEIIIVIDPSNSMFTSQTILLSHLTSIEHPSMESSFIISPNPAGSYLNITMEGISGNGSFAIYSSEGKVIKEFQINTMGSNSYRIDIGNLPQGIYLLEYRSSDARVSGRFIKIAD